ncbi:hypothetical protein LTR10_012488 [Elasticomyces elasticus]|uniref:F-box domain-containing protein n=1 Tax=Elasticomyces elasticus TaxID=574655 RepID=A0AAN7VTY7_9PEZI|nr:hypothetical protein LTR10_012488 [Elasticomyces elasticus]KAK4965962.1 hypothetical protein LTR42_011976 [Elasticomyces elasticus]KAK5692890.1 hypothetical protein LTR97_010366 [Elasticomyces elasticus]KAK5716138.1 hypothetical protein LTR15_009964 [Elasticomyces elasticus]
MATLPPMLALPPELILRISSTLTTPELGCFRRVCKQVEVQLFDSFAREFFTKRQFMIEHPSLQALVGIAKHPVFSKHLVEVIISTDTLTSSAHGNQDLLPRALSAGGYMHRDMLIHTGHARDMLAEAFSKLPNLRTVGLRDYDGKDRIRDGHHAYWRSYGWTFGRDEADHRHHCAQVSPVPLLPMLLYALGSAHATPSNIEVFLRRHPKLTPASFDVVSDATKPVLRALRTVMLHIMPSRPHHRALSNDDDLWHQLPIKRFLGNTPAVEELRLNFEPNERLAHQMLGWLGEAVSAVPANLPHVPSLALPALRTLDLGKLNTDVGTLVSVLAKFDLTTVNLWQVTLQCKDRTEYEGEISRWTRFFEALAHVLSPTSGLKRFSAGYPTQALNANENNSINSILNGAELRRVFFKKDQADDSQKEDKASYRAGYGSSIKHWLEEIAGRIWMPSYQPIDLTDDSEDDENEEDEDVSDDSEGNEEDDVDEDE